MINDVNVRKEIILLFTSTEISDKFWTYVYVYYIKLLYSRINIDFKNLVIITKRVLEQILDSNDLSREVKDVVNVNIVFYKNLLDNC